MQGRMPGVGVAEESVDQRAAGFGVVRCALLHGDWRRRVVRVGGVPIWPAEEAERQDNHQRQQPTTEGPTRRVTTPPRKRSPSCGPFHPRPLQHPPPTGKQSGQAMNPRSRSRSVTSHDR